MTKKLDSKRLRQEQRYTNKNSQQLANGLLSDSVREINFQTSGNLRFKTPSQKAVGVLLCGSIFCTLMTPSRAETTSKSRNDIKSATLFAVNQTCSQPKFIPANIPKMRVDTHDEQIRPSRCMKHLSDKEPLTQECLDDIKVLNEFAKNANKENLDPAVKNERDTFKRSTAAGAAKVANLDKFTPSQARKFNHYQKILIDLEIIFNAASYPEKIGKGNCAEHTAYNAMKFFNIDKESNLKLQRVTLRNKKSRNTHTFLLVDSETNDIDIENNRGESERFLQDIKEGYICDSWNDGYFEKVSKNQNNLYRRFWDTVNVQTISLQFDVSDLPKRAAAFIENELKRFNLSHKLKKNTNNETKFKNEL